MGGVGSRREYWRGGVEEGGGTGSAKRTGQRHGAWTTVTTRALRLLPNGSFPLTTPPCGGRSNLKVSTLLKLSNEPQTLCNIFENKSNCMESLLRVRRSHFYLTT